MTFKELMMEAHATAVEKGWWTLMQDGKVESRDLGEVFCLFHSEVSEALEIHRDPKRKLGDVWFGEDGKPEGFAIELTDLLIRIADWAEASNNPVLPDCQLVSLIEPLQVSRSTATYLNDIHTSLSDAHRAFSGEMVFRTTSGMLALVRAIVIIVSLIGSSAYEAGFHDSQEFLSRCIDLKMSYNKTRPVRHGGKRC
jgi:hypothetical protein